jgi:hypothetical protein
MTRSLKTSLLAYAALLAYLVFVKVTITFIPAVFRSTAQAKVFAWPAIVIFTALGFLGVFLADRTGFPSAWGADLPARRRLLGPTLWGVGLGVLAIATEAATGWTRVVAAKMNLPSIHIDWPASLLIYPGGAIIVEVLYRIFLIPVLLWLVSSVILRSRSQDRVFWVLAMLTSLLEPLSQDLTGILNGPLPVTFAIVFIEDFALNFVQAATFRKYGFLSAVWVRVVFYILWHVLWPALGHR